MKRLKAGAGSPGLSPGAEKEDLPDGKSLKRLKAGAGSEKEY